MLFLFLLNNIPKEAFWQLNTTVGKGQKQGDFRAFSLSSSSIKEM